MKGILRTKYPIFCLPYVFWKLVYFRLLIETSLIAWAFKGVAVLNAKFCQKSLVEKLMNLPKLDGETHLKLAYRPKKSAHSREGHFSGIQIFFSR